MATGRLKPHKGLRKRVKISANGKVRFKRLGAGHLMSGKSGRRRQRLRRKGSIEGQIAANIRTALCAG